MSADTHDLQNCRAWSQAVLSKKKKQRHALLKSSLCCPRKSAAPQHCYKKNKALDECSQDSNNCSASSQEAQSKHKKEAQAITVSAEKQREHNVRTHHLRVEDSCCCTKQTNKCSKKEHYSYMKRNINTEKHRNTPKRNERRPQNSPASHVRPHHEVHQSPEVGGSRLTGVSTGQGGGGAPHGAKRPHLRIIVYISNKRREDQPLNQYG